MNTDRLEERVPELAKALARGGFQKNLARRCAIAAITVGLLVTAAAGLGLADYQLVFPRWVRLVGGGLMLASVAAGMLWLWREWNRFSSARRVALHLERRHPELGCVLSTAVEYAETDALSPGDNPYERVLVERLMQTAVQESSAARPDLWSEARRALPIVAGAGLAGGLLLGLVPDLPVVLKRVMTPWEAVGYTLLDILPGTTDWPAGEPVEVNVSFRGPLTTPPRITWKQGQDPRRTAWMERHGPSEFSFTFPALTAAIDYTIEVARLEPISHRITPVPMPTVRGVEVRITPPDYTGFPVVNSNQLSLSLLSGSRVAISFETDRPLSRVSLQFEDGEQLPMVQSKENTWLAHWFPPETTTYRLVFTDENGRTLVSPRPYPLVVIPDQPPRLRWEPPLPKRTLAVGRALPLPLVISDDFGPVAARFFWKKAGEPARASTLSLQEVRAGEWWGEPVLRIPDGAVQPGDLILAWVEASDARHRTAETVGRSRPLVFVSLPSFPPTEVSGESAETPEAPVDPEPDFLRTTWFNLAWILHSGVFGIATNAQPEAVADLRAEVASLAEWLRIWLRAWDEVEPTEAGRTAAVRQALDGLAPALEAGDREAGIQASEKVLAAIASLLHGANPATTERVSEIAQTNVLKRVAAGEVAWLEAARRWSNELKSTARHLSGLNQRVAGAERIGNLSSKFNEANQRIVALQKEMDLQAAINPLCSHQLLRPVRAAVNAMDLAAASAGQGEPGQAVRDSTRAVRFLMEASNRLDEEAGSGRTLALDGARELSGDPLETVLALYFRRIAEGDPDEHFLP